MLRASVQDGWVVIAPYSGPELAPIHIAVAQRPAEDDWRPAFLDWIGGVRVVKVRTPSPVGRSVPVWLRVGEAVTPAGKVTV